VTWPFTIALIQGPHGTAPLLLVPGICWTLRDRASSPARHDSGECPGTSSLQLLFLSHRTNAFFSFLKCAVAALAASMPRHNSKAPAPGCWKSLVAQKRTIFSHQPGSVQRQLSAGHGTLCYVTDTPPAWLWCAQHPKVLGLLSALDKGAAESMSFMLLHLPLRARRSSLRCCADPIDSYFRRISTLHSTVLPGPGKHHVQRPATSARQAQQDDHVSLEYIGTNSAFSLNKNARLAAGASRSESM
jgi:hypothetical protein